MPRFFVDSLEGERFLLDGEEGRHLVRSLRMRPGETVTLCDGNGQDCLCVIEEIQDTGKSSALLRAVERSPSRSEPTVRVTLYQGVPKSDKMELILQKAVELGCVEIVPVLTEFCVPNLAGKEEAKRERWQKIALEAAKQCGRGVIPQVLSPQPFARAVAEAPGKKLLFYEGGGEALGRLIGEEKEFSVFIGPEGGFSKQETELALEHGAKLATLGPRILRTETAALAAVAALLFATGNLG